MQTYTRPSLKEIAASIERYSNPARPTTQQIAANLQGYFVVKGDSK